MTQLPPSYKTKTLMISLLSALLFSFSVLEASAAALPPAAQPGGVPQGMARPERPSRIEVDIPVVRDRPDVLFDGLDAGVHFAVDDIKIFKIGMNNGVKTREAYVDESLQSIIIDYISKRNGDFTFGYLQDVADKLSDDLKKEDGFLLATVYVPPQKVRNASVEFELLMGELEDVEIVGNDMYAKKYLARAFEDSKGKVVEREAMEESMLLLQEFAGLSASGLLSPGEALGQSKLLITVNSEKRFEGQLLADNYGSDFTGKGRVGAHLEFNNPLNLLDKLTVDIFGVERPNDIANSDDRLQERLYGGFRYEARPFDTRWGMGVEAGSNTYEVG
ncbi:MAG: hemolysin activation/secretion protein, partial [Candidatus Azotimanducaceae bacterium]